MSAFLRKYGAETTIDFSLFEVDGVNFRVDAVHDAGDTAIMKDEGIEVSTTKAFTDEGNGYSLVLTGIEMQAARIVIYVVDQTATKVWLDRSFTIETYGNVLAQHALDLDDAVRGGMTALPNAAADAAGGLPISDAGGLALDTQLANTNEITIARMGALTDWINGGRLDLILDATATATALATAQTDLDTITGTDGVTLATAQALYAPAKSADVATELATYDGPTNAEMIARTLVAASYFDPAADTVANVTTVAALTGQTAQTGDSYGLLTGAQAEPTGVPAANETPMSKLAYIFAALRNKVTVTATSKLFFDDAGVSMHKKVLSDDGTTYTEAESSTP